LLIGEQKERRKTSKMDSSDKDKGDINVSSGKLSSTKLIHSLLKNFKKNTDCVVLEAIKP